jgi:hypothetical protein
MEKASWNEWFQDADIGDHGSLIGKALQTNRVISSQMIF